MNSPHPFWGLGWLGWHRQHHLAGETEAWGGTGWLQVMGWHVQAGPGEELLPAGASQCWELPSPGCYTELMPLECMRQVTLVGLHGLGLPVWVCWDVPCPLARRKLSPPALILAAESRDTTVMGHRTAVSATCASVPSAVLSPGWPRCPCRGRTRADAGAGWKQGGVFAMGANEPAVH